MIETVYLVIRSFLCHAGLDVTHKRINEAFALSHCLPRLLFATAQIPRHNAIINLNPHRNTYCTFSMYAQQMYILHVRTMCVHGWYCFWT